MKHCLTFLRNSVRQTLLSGSSDSILCASVGYLVFGLFAVSVISCGPPPQGQYHVPETALAAAERTTRPGSGQQQVSLPTSANIQLQRMPYVRNAFKEPPRVPRRGGLDNFYATTRGTVQNMTIISNISMDVLKAFLAKGWASVVVLQMQGRNPEIVVLSDYNDSLNEISLQNPTSLTKRRLSYKDFETAWRESSQNKCILITPQKLSDIDIENVLGRYLRPEVYKDISIRSR